MNWESLSVSLENLGILLGIGGVLGYIGYTICLFNPVRLLAFAYIVYWIYQSIIIKDHSALLVLGSFNLVFIIRFYRLNPYFCRKIFKPFVLLFRGSAEAGKFALSVADGTLTGRKQLQREKAEFEREKAFYEGERRRQAEEWENIKRAWEKLFEERERWEREKTGEEKKEYKREYRGYEESREKTGANRFFKEFAKFDLEKFEKNDPYEVLGVSRRASHNEVKKTFRKLQKIYHPDMFNKEDIEEKLIEAEKISKLLNFCYEKIINKMA